jgi:hypothetical protein
VFLAEGRKKMSDEQFWRNKIAEEVEQAWSNLVLRNYYSNDLATKMIIKYIRSGNDETLQ